jgi:hypothetical protein
MVYESWLGEEKRVPARAADTRLITPPELSFARVSVIYQTKTQVKEMKVLNVAPCSNWRMELVARGSPRPDTRLPVAWNTGTGQGVYEF